MSPPSASTSSREPSGSIFTRAAGAIVRNPPHRFAFFHARQFDDAAVLAHGLANALVALFILHLHPADVGRDADMVGNENNQRVGIRILAILFDRGKFFFVRSAAKKTLHPAHKKHLEWRHQRGCAGPVEHFGEIVFREVELEQTEVAKISRNQVLENGVSKALAEESFIAHKHIGRTQLARLQFADKPIGLGESPHQKISSVWPMTRAAFLACPEQSEGTSD